MNLPRKIRSFSPNIYILVSGEVVSVERFSFELDDGYERKQFPLILGWAFSIHKVQGMQAHQPRRLQASFRAIFG
jgi:hypothetical protein